MFLSLGEITSTMMAMSAKGNKQSSFDLHERWLWYIIVLLLHIPSTIGKLELYKQFGNAAKHDIIEL